MSARFTCDELVEYRRFVHSGNETHEETGPCDAPAPYVVNPELLGNHRENRYICHAHSPWHGNDLIRAR